MTKLKMMKGLPASGKTTKARDIVEKSGYQYTRVNKDDLRKMMYGSYWKPKLEGNVAKVCKSMVRSLLNAGSSVVVDNTNLFNRDTESWQTIADECGATFEVVSMKTCVEECVRRNWERVAQGRRGVPPYVVRNMALQHKLDPSVRDILIVDIDGTVADGSHREHLLTKDGKNWGLYFSLMHLDTPIHSTLEQVKTFQSRNPQARVIFVSARPQDYQEETQEWLKKFTGIDFYSLIMRKSGDYREDSIVKKELYESYLQWYNVVQVFDDRPRVIRMWQSLGLPVTDVGKGVEF